MGNFEEEYYLDSKSKDKLLAEIDELRSKLKHLKENYTGSNLTDKYDVELEDITRKINILSQTIDIKLKHLKNATMIEKEEDIETVNLDDVIEIETIFENEVEQDVFKLVAGEADFFKDIRELSINSPLGHILYKKKVGETVKYSVNGVDIEVLIKTKLNLEDTLGTTTR